MLPVRAGGSLRRWFRRGWAGAALGLSACAGDPPTRTVSIDGAQLLEVARDGVTLWYNQPSAVRYVGRHDRTYFAWATSAGDVQVRHYDHGTHAFSPVVTVHRWSGTDDHAAPAIEVVRSGPAAGRLLLGFAFHSTPLLATRSESPEDISAWAPADTVHPMASYPRLVTLDAATTVLLFRSFPRNEPTTGHLSYALSQDGGATWGAAIPGIRVAEGSFVYGGPAYADGTRIGVAWSVYDAASARFRPQVYHAELDPARGEWFDASGRTVGAVVPEGFAPILASPDGAQVRVWDAIADRAGTPHLAFVSFARETLRCCGGAAGTGYWARLDPESRTWAVSETGPVAEAEYAGGLVLDAADPRVIYQSRPAGRGASQIVTLRTPDSGATWLTVGSVSGTAGAAARPQAIRNAHPELPLTWLRVHAYQAYNDFRTSLMATRLRRAAGGGAAPG